MSINNIKRKSTKRYKFTFTNVDGSVKDITGWKIYFIAKKNIDDADSNALIAVNTTAGNDTADDVTNGIMYLTLETNDTDVAEDTYFYAFTRVIPGAVIDRKEIDSGTFDIEKSVQQDVV